MQHLFRYLRHVTAIAGVSYIVAAGMITIDGLSDNVPQADLIVVPGNTVNSDGSLSNRLKGRLDAALSVFKIHHTSFIFVSGAVGKEGVDEAVAMKAYLISKGVPPEQIIQDSAGFNTEATAKNAVQAMRQLKLNRAIATSQFFHITRLKLLLQRHGASVVGNTHATYFESRDFYSLAREVIALLALSLRNTAS
jgi:vancomycin permeability regulator SanA